jgi:hypothetical protein
MYKGMCVVITKWRMSHEYRHNLARNTGPDAGRSFADMAAQCGMGLLPEWRDRAGVVDRHHFAGAGQDLVSRPTRAGKFTEDADVRNNDVTAQLLGVLGDALVPVHMIVH